MRKEDLENLTLTSQRNRGKQYMTDITRFCKWLTEQGFGEIAKTNFNNEIVVSCIVSRECTHL